MGRSALHHKNFVVKMINLAVAGCPVERCGFQHGGEVPPMNCSCVALLPGEESCAATGFSRAVGPVDCRPSAYDKREKGNWKPSS